MIKLMAMNVGSVSDRDFTYLGGGGGLHTSSLESDKEEPKLEVLLPLWVPSV